MLFQLLAEQDPAIYVLDPLPNMDAAAVTERIPNFVKTLRNARPKTPIVLVESLEYTDGDYVSSRRERFSTSNVALKKVYEDLRKSGVKGITYVSAENLIGKDFEGTVDGTHPNDLGFMRMADKIGPVVQKLLKSSAH